MNLLQLTTCIHGTDVQELCAACAPANDCCGCSMDCAILACLGESCACPAAYCGCIPKP